MSVSVFVPFHLMKWFLSSNCRGLFPFFFLSLIGSFLITGKRRYNIKLWKTFTDCFNCLPVAAIVDEKIFCCHGGILYRKARANGMPEFSFHVSNPFCVFVSGLSPDLQSMEQIRRVMRPTDVPDQGLLCDLLWADPDKDVTGWGENDRGVSFTFGSDVVAKFLHKHDMDLICRAHQV